MLQVKVTIDGKVQTNRIVKADEARPLFTRQPEVWANIEKLIVGRKLIAEGTTNGVETIIEVTKHS